MHFWVRFSVLLAVKGLVSSAHRSFTIDKLHNTLLKDGQPFNYVSGSMHYSRVPAFYWKDRLTKMRAAGLDAVQTYIPWNFHEPGKGQFLFDGDRDLFNFLDLAKDAGLLVILRLGPYICGEWEYGGFPYWLLTDSGSIKVRTMDPDYIRAVDDYWHVLLPKLKPYLYNNGGPVIMAQIENEYGSYYACDHKYMEHLRDLAAKLFDNNVVLFTTDGAGINFLKCGAVNGTYATVDFGPGNVTSSFAPMRQWNPHGPLINSEFYTGWLDYWGHTHAHGDTGAITKTLSDILSMKASVNMYMFEGGTNFGYTSGADPEYSICPTSYDYDAPLTEAGDITDKYRSIRETIGKYKTLPSVPIPPSTPKAAYGDVKMRPIGSFLDHPSIVQGRVIESTFPLSMEQVKQGYGFILYRHILKQTYSGHQVTINKLRDRAHVLLDGQLVCILDRNEATSFNLIAQEKQTLDILVENQGRVNFGTQILDARKGIVGNVTVLSQNLTDWKIYPLNLTKMFNETLLQQAKAFQPSSARHLPSFYSGTFDTDAHGGPADTYLSTPGWFKGQAFINGFNLGRYWPVRGPQKTLFVPKNVLHPGSNTVILFELDYAPCQTSSSCSVKFVNIPVVNGTIG